MNGTTYSAMIMEADGTFVGKTEHVNSIPECRQLVMEFIQNNEDSAPEFYTINEYVEDEHTIEESVVECMPVDAIRKDTVIHDQLVLGKRAMTLLGRAHWFVACHEKDADPYVQQQVKTIVKVLEMLMEVE